MIAALEARLADLAARGATITYGALAREMGARVAEVTAALERLMDEDAAAGRPFRAALCEGRLAGGLPAPGFFLKAADLGRYRGPTSGPDAAAFAAAERAGLFKPGG